MKVLKLKNEYYMIDGDVKTQVYPDKNGALVLPSNSCNRKYCNITKLEKAGDVIDYGDAIKETRHMDVSKRTPKKSRREYLTGDDLKEYDRLNALIDERIAAEKPLTKKEKLQSDAQKAWDAMKAAGIDPTTIYSPETIKALGINV